MQSGETADLRISYPKGYNNMWHVILRILAVCGIVLLVLLALCILTVLSVLFVPVRYRASGEKEADRTEGKATARFLYPLLSFRWQYAGGESSYALRLLGIKLMGSPKKNTKKNRKQEGKRISDDGPDETGKNDHDRQTPAQPADREAPARKTIAEETPQRKETAADKPRFTISALCDKIRNIRDNTEYYKERLTAKENRLFLQRVKERLLAVLKSIKPKVLTARVVCGTGSPDTTGYLCALYGILYPVLTDKVSFTADFENKILEGSFSAKGKIRVVTLLRHGIGILRDKQLKAFIKEMKRED